MQETIKIPTSVLKQVAYHLAAAENTINYKTNSPDDEENNPHRKIGGVRYSIEEMAELLNPYLPKQEVKNG